MWISKTKLDSIERRLAWLEKEALTIEVPTVRMDRLPTLYDYKPRYRINVTHQVLLLKILAHLGLKLEAVDETPATVNLVKAEGK